MQTTVDDAGSHTVVTGRTAVVVEEGGELGPQERHRPPTTTCSGWWTRAATFYGERMEIAALLTESFDRIAELVPTTVDGLSDDQLAVRPEGPAGSKGNSIAWLIWHLSRVQDDHLADVAGTEQVWAQGWRERFALSLSDADGIGYGHTPAEVAEVRAPADLLAGYHEAVAAATTEFVSELGATDLDRIVDRRFDPPVTLGARLTSVVSDCLQHVGQAAYVRGLMGS